MVQKQAWDSTVNQLWHTLNRIEYARVQGCALEEVALLKRCRVLTLMASLVSLGVIQENVNN